MKTIAFVTIILAGVAALAQQAAPVNNIDNGKRLYSRDGCWECHGWAGQGGRDGARLADTALTTAQLKFLLGGFRDQLDLSELVEWTLEANPGSVSAGKAELM